jgi:hypothetical protein
MAAAALAAGLAAAVPAATPAAAGPPAISAGWNYVATYPSKGECLSVGQAGVPQRWDDFRCQPHIDPLRAPATSPSAASSGWDLWAVVYVG